MIEWIFIYPGARRSVWAESEAEAWAMFNARHAEFLLWEEYEKIEIHKGGESL